MAVVTQEELRSNHGWVPTARLRWAEPGILQQRWVHQASGRRAWRLVPSAGMEDDDPEDTTDAGPVE